LALAIALLAGIGLDGFVRSERTGWFRWATLGGFAAAGVMLAGIWVTGRGSLPYKRALIREASFGWPVITVLVGMLIVAALLVADDPAARSRRRAKRSVVAATAALLLVEAAFMVGAAAPLKSSSATFAPTTPGVQALQAAVGDSLVGLGDASCIRRPAVGIWPNMNIVFGVREFAVYDPVIPHAYFRDLRALTGRPPGYSPANVFCPIITTADIARLYGIAYVVELPGSAGPAGAVFVGKVGSEELYRIPGAAFAVTVPVPLGAPLPPLEAPGTPVLASQPDASQWSLTTTGATAQLLRIHLTAVPGWHATIDGRPLALKPYTSLMLRARIPPGRHTIQLSYWPGSFTAGLMLAAVAAVALVVLVVVGRRRAAMPAAFTAGVEATGNGSGPHPTPNGSSARPIAPDPADQEGPSPPAPGTTNRR
jgi:hypothetical protein